MVDLGDRSDAPDSRDLAYGVAARTVYVLAGIVACAHSLLLHAKSDV